uniref:Uncharacterized protein n=1 Tax=Melopsittacus undulatus TaxID=13146 RepID=A0A8V5GUU9_MELUD
MLNRIIRLQAAVEIVVNKTGDTLGLIAKQNTKMRTAIYQNRLALDYLLAQEGGVCEKFNLNNCCLKIDDEGNAISELVREMKKITHVPVQTWNGINLGGLESWRQFFNGDWITKMGIVLLGIFGGLLIISCIIPCFTRLIHTIIQNTQFTTVPLDSEIISNEKTHSLMVLRNETIPVLSKTRKTAIKLKKPMNQ